jgi:hypothetical protein
MIKARGVCNDGYPLVFIAISNKQAAELADGAGLVIELGDMDLPPTRLMFVIGRDEASIAGDLVSIGLVPAGIAAEIGLVAACREIEPEDVSADITWRIGDHE